MPIRCNMSKFFRILFLEFFWCFHPEQGFPGGSEGKASAYKCGRPGFDPWVGKIPGEGNGNLLQYSCLENPMDWEAWYATVHGVAKNRTRLSHFTFTSKRAEQRMVWQNPSVPLWEKRKKFKCWVTILTFPIEVDFRALFTILTPLIAWLVRLLHRPLRPEIQFLFPNPSRHNSRSLR